MWIKVVEIAFFLLLSYLNWFDALPNVWSAFFIIIIYSSSVQLKLFLLLLFFISCSISTTFLSSVLYCCQSMWRFVSKIEMMIQVCRVSSTILITEHKCTLEIISIENVITRMANTRFDGCDEWCSTFAGNYRQSIAFILAFTYWFDSINLWWIDESRLNGTVYCKTYSITSIIY